MRRTVLAGALLLLAGLNTGCQKQPSVSTEQPERPVAAGQAAQAAAQKQQAPASRFTDLADAPTKDYIVDLERLGVFEGLGDEFKPYQPITRGEYVTWLFKAYNALRDDKIRMAAPGEPSPFKDLSKEHPSYPYVSAFAGAGYSVGYDDGSFRADQPITREEMIAMKFGVDRNENKNADAVYNQYFPFEDKNDVDKRYRGNAYYDAETAEGQENNFKRAFGASKNFKPKALVMRHEAAATLWQMDRWGGATAKKALEKETARN